MNLPKKIHLFLLFFFVIASKLREAQMSISDDHHAKQERRNHRNLKGIKTACPIASLPRPFWVHVVSNNLFPITCHSQ